MAVMLPDAMLCPSSAHTMQLSCTTSAHVGTCQPDVPRPTKSAPFCPLAHPATRFESLPRVIAAAVHDGLPGWSVRSWVFRSYEGVPLTGAHHHCREERETRRSDIEHLASSLVGKVNECVAALDEGAPVRPGCLPLPLRATVSSMLWPVHMPQGGCTLILTGDAMLRTQCRQDAPTCSPIKRHPCSSFTPISMQWSS
jgi:hypothetical protein